MNQKKCPKCGENNPAEAVMCWACYTPLSGAPVATGPIPGSTPAPGEAPEKKPIAPWQIGVIGLALLIAAGFGISTLMSGSSSADPGMESPITNDTGPRVIPPSGSGGPGVTLETPSMSPNVAQQPAQQVPTGGADSYTVTTPPSRGSSTAVVGIVPNVPNVRPQQAAQLAASLGRRLKRSGNWNSIQVYVFADRQTAGTFQTHQSQRKGAPLDGDDFTRLGGIWSQTLARYEVNGGRESITYPQQSPDGWWSGGRRA